MFARFPQGRLTHRRHTSFKVALNLCYGLLGLYVRLDMEIEFPAGSLALANVYPSAWNIFPNESPLAFACL